MGGRGGVGGELLGEQLVKLSQLVGIACVPALTKHACNKNVALRVCIYVHVYLR